MSSQIQGTIRLHVLYGKIRPRLSPMPSHRFGLGTASHSKLSCGHKYFLVDTRKFFDPSSLSRLLARHSSAFHKLKICRRADFLNVCGPEEIRTPDLPLAKRLLYQLSYGPMSMHFYAICVTEHILP